MSSVGRTAAAWPSEREVADLVVMGVEPDTALETLSRVPFWFHTFALNREAGIYTPGVARDHGYRLAVIPESFRGLGVLDVGTFDGFYSYLAAARGASRVLAIDNEQYVDWVEDRWHVTLSGGEGFHAIHRLLDSDVEYRRMDVFDLGQVEEKFDFIFCFGVLHRIENPLGLLRLLVRHLADEGRIAVETYGVVKDAGANDGLIYVSEPAEIYPGDEFVYWQFSSGSLKRLARHASDANFELVDVPIIDDHPRLLGFITR
jgi:tRNA (mo5U34)-methyltransferase